MKAVIQKSTARGQMTVPASKSYAHRLLICAGLAEGESRIHRLDRCEDVLASVDCLTAMGAQIHLTGDTALVRGCGGHPDRGVFPCRESGSTLRFLLPPALLGGGGRFTGAPRLMERGVGVYRDLLSPRGIEFAQEACAIAVSGTLRSGSYRIAGDISSQFISGMLFALPLCDGDSLLEVTEPFESRSYVSLTLDVLAQSGIQIETKNNEYRISGGQRYRPLDTAVEGDWSNAAFFCALNALGGEVHIDGLRADSRQGDRVCVQLLERLRTPDAVIDLSDCPDLAPVLFAAAAAMEGGRFTGTRRLAIKESNRAAVMAQELAKFGIRVQCDANSVQVFPGGLHAPCEPLDGHNDHRIVMALSVLATRTGGVIEGAEAVAKSYPDFFEALQKAGVELTYGAE